MFYCEWCDIEIPEENAKSRVEDDTFTAPYGDTFVSGGGECVVKTCPLCDYDLKEVVEC